MGRELRQAREVDAVQFAVGSTGSTALTIWTDFDRNGVRATGAADPEVLTYRWTPSTGQLTLTANDTAGTEVTKPVLAEVVSAFDLRLRSSLWEYDANADGVTTWEELDASAIGNGNTVPDVELKKIDLISIRLTVTEGKAARTFYMQVDLRNRAQN